MLLGAPLTVVIVWKDSADERTRRKDHNPSPCADAGVESVAERDEDWIAAGARDEGPGAGPVAGVLLRGAHVRRQVLLLLLLLPLHALLLPAASP
jgi:hypothetical protein